MSPSILWQKVVKTGEQKDERRKCEKHSRKQELCSMKPHKRTCADGC